jgi:SAM-dependent methyltransferase
MLLDSSEQSWTRYTPKEIDYVIETCGIKSGAVVFDFGCGTGRHSIELGKRDSHIKIIGVDYIPGFVKRATKDANGAGLTNTEFRPGDCRRIDLKEKADVVMCLYDVVGTFPAHEDNMMVLRNIFKHLKPGGRAVISVMNYELTARLATKWFSLEHEADKLSELRPSKIMETTGNVFNPDYFMIDRETRVVYRREQFATGKSIPVELIVRDYRYKKEEIEGMCKEVGFNVLTCQFTRAGGWFSPLERGDDRAKEILLVCEKPLLQFKNF